MDQEYSNVIIQELLMNSRNLIQFKEINLKKFKSLKTKEIQFQVLIIQEIQFTSINFFQFKKIHSIQEIGFN